MILTNFATVITKVTKMGDISKYINFKSGDNGAIVNALKQKYPKRKLIACIELHTFSSLQKNFIPQYNGAMDKADTAIVYYNREVLKHKQLPDIPEEYVKECFGGNVTVYTDTNKLQDYLRSTDCHGTNYLMMSSGNFNGVDFKKLAEELKSTKKEKKTRKSKKNIEECTVDDVKLK